MVKQATAMLMYARHSNYTSTVDDIFLYSNYKNIFIPNSKPLPSTPTNP
jgi:hypothetical protein